MAGSSTNLTIVPSLTAFTGSAYITIICPTCEGTGKGKYKRSDLPRCLMCSGAGLRRKLMSFTIYCSSPHNSTEYRSFHHAKTLSNPEIRDKVNAWRRAYAKKPGKKELLQSYVKKWRKKIKQQGYSSHWAYTMSRKTPEEREEALKAMRIRAKKYFLRKKKERSGT